MGESLLAFSSLVQALALAQAVRLAARERHAGWVFLAAGIALMLARRGVSLFAVLFQRRSVDPVAEFIALLISLMMAVGLTILLRWRKREAAVTSSAEATHDDALGRLQQQAVLLATVALFACAVLSSLAYTGSGDAVMVRLLKGNLDLAHMLETAARAAPDRAAALDELDRLWREARSQYPDNFLQVIGSDGRLLLDTGRPDSVGSFVGATAIAAGGNAPRTIQDLLEARGDWAGRSLNADGEGQISAYAYSATLPGLVAVHLPASRVDAETRAAALPWGVGIGLIFAVVLPASFGLLYYVGTSSQRAAFQALTRQHETEQRLRLAVEAASVGLWDVDLHTDTAWYSPEWKRQIGYEDEEIPNRIEEWRSRIHPDDHRRALAILKVHFEAQRSNYESEFRMRHKDGSYRWILARASVITDARGIPVRMLGSHLDITERKQIEEQVNQFQRMEAIGALAGGVAHDFNNVLAAILGNAELALGDTAEDHPARASLNEIKRAAVRAKNLVQQILAFSRQQPQQRRVLALAPLLGETVRLLRATIPASVELRTSSEEDIPNVLADPTQMDQILVNLCTNAWHAIGDQPGRIAIELHCVEIDAEPAGLRPGRFVRLSVADTGTGMDAVTLGRIFEPFFTTKGPGKGTGLGLSVVHGIVLAHDGAITVESQPGRGATFRVYLPAVEAPADAIPEVAAPRRGAGQHILFLDDEEPLVYLATRMLERLGYRVTGFSHAAAALRAFRENPDQFDLVITDLNMPDVSGLDVAVEILRLRPDMPIVLSSGHVTEELKQRAHSAGIRHVLYKPNAIEEFGDAIHRLCGS